MDNPTTLLRFPGCAEAPIENVGGKAGTLIRMCALGLPVPAGAVLCSAFFRPWIERSLATAEWQALQHAAPGERAALCGRLTLQARGWALAPAQREVMEELRATLTEMQLDCLAVRSSSPQEDLHGASFAGGYETVLGVRLDGVEEAVRRCFASIFDERVIAYRLARGLGLDTPAMAVLVQQQLDSQVAGVAFSLNPLNNDHDEAVIAANWGLGDSVVAGRVTPDHWVVERHSGKLLEQSIARKSHSVWLDAAGGVNERENAQSDQACLTPDQLHDVVQLVQRVEQALDCPVDIEWAIADARLHLLQARPVTTHVAVAAAMRSAPTAPRRLYMDLALSSGLTINAPISTMGLDVFRRLFAGMAGLSLGEINLSPVRRNDLVLMTGSRMYLDLSNTFWLSSPRRMADSMRMNDALMARLIESVDPVRYRSPERPDWARWRMLLRIPGVLWRLRRSLLNALLPFLAPRRMQRRLAGQLEAIERTFGRDSDSALPLDIWWERHMAACLPPLFQVSLPIVGPAVLAVQAFSRLAAPLLVDQPELGDQLDRGFEGNVVVDMNIAMYRLAQQLPAAARGDGPGLAEGVNSAALSPGFEGAWKAFLSRYGSRGPLEMDIAHPRYADGPGIALHQIASMPVDDERADPEVAARRQVERRRAAMAEVVQRAGPLRRRLLRHLQCVIEGFAGWRDTPKQHLLLLLHRLRRRLLLEGEALQRSGRLDTAAGIFDLDIAELLAAQSDPQLDLRQRASERAAERTRLAKQVINFPPLIDSRGRILQPAGDPRADGVLQGVGLSRGLARGRARTLRSPHDGPLRRGEVLIAYTTDPGWTPIFINAAAVVLEIGGALQHGAVVARELGLPCVAGISGISTAIEDGSLIEVDGAAGTVRKLSGLETPTTDEDAG
jgi:pyruvate,water dikinase